MTDEAKREWEMSDQRPAFDVGDRALWVGHFVGGTSPECTVTRIYDGDSSGLVGVQFDDGGLGIHPTRYLQAIEGKER